MSVSLVARRHGIAPNQLFTWRRLPAARSRRWAPGEEVVAASEYQALQHQVRELQRLLGKKILENEILREALDRRGDGALVWPTRVRARHPERIGDRLHGVSSRAGEGARNRVASKSGWTHKPVVQAGTNERPIFVA
jgi:Transposase